MHIAITRLKEKETNDKKRCMRHGHECYSVSPLSATINSEEIGKFINKVKQRYFDCIFFTSALPASIISPLLASIPLPRIIAIGPQTGKILRSNGVLCEVLPSFYSKAFVPYLGSWITGKRIGIPHADVPNDALLHAISSAGGEVHDYRCYALSPTYELIDLSDGKTNAILFTSSKSFSSSVWRRRTDLITIAIGEVTAETMVRAGMKPDIVGDGSLEGTLEEVNLYLLLHP
jgi:uroporphyrinogen-III synthase